jgi:hypothetical protein
VQKPDGDAQIARQFSTVLSTGTIMAARRIAKFRFALQAAAAAGLHCSMGID